MPRVGSSSRRRSAPPTATAAIATRCRWPPERLRGWWSASVVEPEGVEPVVDGAVVAAGPSRRRVSAISARTVAREQQRVRVLGHVGAVGRRLDAAGVRGEQAAEDAEQRGLARAVAAEQRDDLAAVDLDVDLRAAPGAGRARRRCPAARRQELARRRGVGTWLGRRRLGPVRPSRRASARVRAR